MENGNQANQIENYKSCVAWLVINMDVTLSK
jgi:hypothetical protein